MSVRFSENHEMGRKLVLRGCPLVRHKGREKSRSKSARHEEILSGVRKRTSRYVKLGTKQVLTWVRAPLTESASEALQMGGNALVKPW